MDAWRKDYNTSRPHQSLAMAFPAARFTPAAGDALGLRIPADLASRSPPSVLDADPRPLKERLPWPPGTAAAAGRAGPWSWTG